MVMTMIGDQNKPAIEKSSMEVVGEQKKLKPCCACPETKRARDMCIVEKGEAECGHLIEAHKQCMREMGFKI